MIDAACKMVWRFVRRATEAIGDQLSNLKV
jgi:hypothetical protein